MHLFKFLLCIALITTTIISCDKTKEADVTPSDLTFKTGTITHGNGFDFSAEKGDTLWANQDGYTASWPFTQDRGAGVFGFWYSPYDFNSVKWLGTTDIANITVIDTSWDTSVGSHPLRNGEVWAAKCRDGFVLFEVTSNPPTDSLGVAQASSDWAVDVKYLFSSSISFN